LAALMDGWHKLVDKRSTLASRPDHCLRHS